jgi:hypothetical protein
MSITEGSTIESWKHQNRKNSPAPSGSRRNSTSCRTRASRAYTSRLALFALLLPLFAAGVPPAFSQTPTQIVQTVVNNELSADTNDHTSWMYRDTKQSPGKSSVRLVVETAHGNIFETIESNGQPLDSQDRQQEFQRIDQTVNDPDAQQKQKKNDQHDEQQARSMMELLPKAFIWTETGRKDGDIYLTYKPDPNFDPPSMASHVLAAMSGTLIVNAKQMRLTELKGTLLQPVEFAWGLLGKLDPGGIFHIVRQEIAPGEWQITQTHVHIHGHALLFKSIGDQEDEETSDYHPTPASLTLKEAAQMLKNGTVARELGVEIGSGQ